MVSANVIRAQIAGETMYPKNLKALVCLRLRRSDVISDKMAIHLDMRMDRRLSVAEDTSIASNVQLNFDVVHSLHHHHSQQLSRHYP
jgi:hypothetical protein